MLTLPIKKEWFNLILSGIKKEEYREHTPYYSTRFYNLWGSPENWSEHKEIKLRNGYGKNSPSIIIECSLRVGSGKKEWGGSEKKTYILTIHKIKTPEVYNG